MIASKLYMVRSGNPTLATAKIYFPVRSLARDRTEEPLGKGDPGRVVGIPVLRVKYPDIEFPVPLAT